MSEDKDNTPDASDARSGPARDAASQVTPLFAEGDSGSDGGLPEQAQQPTISEKAVREQVQRVRLDLLARETERLDRRLAQLLDQQQEDRQLRDRLQAEVGTLCERVDQLIAGSEPGADGTSSGADLRTTVKPLLQAVLDMLDGPNQKAPAGSGGAPAPQDSQPATRQTGPRPPRSSGTTVDARARQEASAGAASAAAPPRQVERRPERPAVTEPPRQPAQAASGAGQTPPRPAATPGSRDRLADQVDARNVVLQRALSRLEQAARGSAPTGPNRPEANPVPKAGGETARGAQTAASPSQSSGAAARTAPKRNAPGTDDLPARPTETSRPHQPPTPVTPVPKQTPVDDFEDSMGAEDPAIEIARLLRPLDAKSERESSGRGPGGSPKATEIPPGPAAETLTNVPNTQVPAPSPSQPRARAAEPVAQRTAPPVTAPAPRRAAEPERQLGTDDTPKMREQTRRQPPPTAKAGPRDGSAVRQRLMRSALARRANGAIARDRAAPEAPRSGSGGPKTTVPPGRPADRPPGPPSTAAFVEPETEPLPRCLTEPWEDLDADLARLRGGQDKGARRWPFRRARSGDQGADHGDDEGSD